MWDHAAVGTFFQQAHGEVIRSNIRLPEYMSAAGTDVNPLLIHTIPLEEEVSSPQGITALEGGGYKLWWSSSGEFFVSDKGNILHKRSAGASDALIRLPLLGTVLSVALSTRHRFVLHGNAVSINGRAVIIVGHRGQGKTTLTASLLMRGHRLIADDVSTLAFDPEGLRVHRGALQLRLWPDSVEQFFPGQIESFEQLYAGQLKRIVPALEFATEQQSVPLAGIICLYGSDEVSLETLSTVEAWKEIVSHSFHTRLGSSFLRDERASWHHGQCVRLARSTKVHRFHRPRTYPRLEEVAQYLEQAFA